VILALLTKLGLPQWLAEMLCGVLIVGLLAGGGYYKGFHDKAAGDEIAQQQAELKHAAQVTRLQHKADEKAAAFDQDELYIRGLETKLQKRVPNVIKVYRAAPGAPLQPVPACVFTGGFVRLWNRANDPGVPTAPAGAGAPADAGDAAGAGDELDSGVTQGDVLNNEIANGAECAVVKDQLNKILDLYAEAKDKQ
jgi:hypothetical protein